MTQSFALPIAFGLLLGVGASAAPQLSLEASAPTLVLGRDESAQLRLRGSPEALRDARLSCSQGAVRGVRRPSQTELVAEYVPPRLGVAQWVLCGAASPAAGAAQPVPIALLRREAMALSGLPPLSRVEVHLGRGRFGPVRANAAGSAEIAVLIPPGVRSAQVHATPPGGAEEIRDQPVPAEPACALLLLGPAQLVADGRTGSRIFAFAAGPRGEPWEVTPALASRDGAVSGFERLSPGAGRATFTPFARGAAGEASISASAAGVRTSLRIETLPGVKPQLALATSARAVPADGFTGVELTITITDESGRGLAGQALSVSADVGAVGAPEEQGAGIYVARYVAPAGGPKEAQLSASVPGAKAAALRLALTARQRLSVETSPREARADGRSRVLLTISAHGPDGLPLPEGTPIHLSSSLGTVPPLAAISAGRAEVELVASTRAGAANVEVRSEGAAASVRVRFVPGPPAKVVLTPERAAIACRGGEPLQLQIAVEDDFGNGVDSAPLELSDDSAAGGAGGRFDEVVPMGEGRFAARYRAPRCDQREVTLFATSGGLSGSARVRVVRVVRGFSGFSGALGLTVGTAGEQNLGRAFSAGFGAEADFPMPSSRLRGSVALDLLQSAPWEATASRPLGGSFAFAASTRQGSLYLGPRWTLFEDERLLLWIGGGVDCHWIRVAYRAPEAAGLPAVQQGVAFGGHARLGLGYGIGPGLAVAQVRLGVAPWSVGDSAVRGNASGAAVGFGYRLAF